MYDKGTRRAHCTASQFGIYLQVIEPEKSIKMNPQGKKEIVEAVLIASLCAAATGLISWGIEHLKAKFKKPDHKPEAKPEVKRPL